MAGTFLRDVEYRDTKTATCVKVPTPQAGTYQDEGVEQAVCATLWLPKGRMTPNREQDGVTTRGWCVLDPTHVYTVSWSQRDGRSIHSDMSRRRLKPTGAQIAAANDTFGRPALERTRKERARVPQATGQMRLFDDSWSPTYDVGSKDVEEPRDEAVGPAQYARTPIENVPDWARDPDLFYDHDVEF